MYTVVILMTLTAGSDSADFGRRGCRGCHSRHSCHSCYGCHSYGCQGCGGGVVSCGGGYVVISGPGGPPASGGPPAIGGKTGGEPLNGETKGTSGAGTDLSAADKGRFDRVMKQATPEEKQDLLETLKKQDAAGRAKSLQRIEDEIRKAEDKFKDKDEDKGKDKGKDKDKDKEDQVSAPATLLVTLPADAKLFVDDALTSQTTAVRVFSTPPLARGWVYPYTLRAEVVRDGVRVTTSQRVRVRAGAESRVTISFSAGAVARQ